MNRAQYDRFYEIFDRLTDRIGGARRLGDLHDGPRLPERGVYFFLEPGETRGEGSSALRVVRVGTHGLTPNSQATLTTRLGAHHGNKGGRNGNHRGSVFRKIVGQALIRRAGADVPPWGIGSSRQTAVERTGLDEATIMAMERPWEETVSDVLRDMSFVWLAVNDPPGPNSARASIEAGAIALLSSPGGDSPSRGWLGSYTNDRAVISSGLWNRDFVGTTPDPGFLDRFERLVG